MILGLILIYCGGQRVSLQYISMLHNIMLNTVVALCETHYEWMWVNELTIDKVWPNFVDDLTNIGI